MDLLWRFLLGGAIVSLFALLGEVLRPKRFAGKVQPETPAGQASG
jgi:hypothetical protein